MSVFRLSEEAYAAQLKRRRARVANESTIALTEPRPRIATGRIRDGGMNKLEAAYAQHLDLLAQAGEVLWYRYEAIKLRLADATFLTVDFAVMLADGQLEMHECKGFMRDDAAVKLKVAANAYPFAFKLVRKAKGGTWDIKQI